MKDIETSWMIQRLHAPSHSLFKPLSPVPGFSEQAQDALKQLFTLDYMGASELEGTIVARTLRQMAQKESELVVGHADITIEPYSYEVSRAQSDLERYRKYVIDAEDDDYFKPDLVMAEKAVARSLNPPIEVPIYIIAPPHLMEHAQLFVMMEADDSNHLMEPTWLRDSVIGFPSSAKNLGWLELDNGFFFFKDWTMFNNVAAALELKHDYAPPVAPVRPQSEAAAANEPIL